MVLFRLLLCCLILLSSAEDTVVTDPTTQEPTPSPIVVPPATVETDEPVDTEKATEKATFKPKKRIYPLDGKKPSRTQINDGWLEKCTAAIESLEEPVSPTVSTSSPTGTPTVAGETRAPTASTGTPTGTPTVSTGTPTASTTTPPYITDVICFEVKTKTMLRLTLQGDVKQIEKLIEAMEHGTELEIDGHKYKLEEGEEGPDPFVALVSCFGIMAFIFTFILCFFALKEWPNSPAKIEERKLLREKEEKDRVAEERRKKEEEAMFSI